jgi:hypothetical protein
MARSTRLVELSSPVSPETLEEPTEAFQLRPERPFRGNELISLTHKRTEGRAPVWGSEFTSKRRRTTGGIQQNPL